MFRRFLVASSVVAVLSVSACTPTYFDTTSDLHTPRDGGWADSGNLSLRKIVVVADQQGSGTLVGTIVNRGDRADRLVSLEPQGGEASLEPVAVPRSGRLTLGATGPGGQGPVEYVEVRGNEVEAGRMIDMTFEFQGADPAEVEVPVVEREGPYEDVPLPEEQKQAPPVDDNDLRSSGD